MRTPQHQNILILILKALLVYFSYDKLFKADHALLFFHLAFTQCELYRMEVANLKYIVILATNASVLLIYHGNNELSNFE